MIKKITKEFIIEYLQDYYEKHKKIPISGDKEHPFCEKTVSNKFGTWNKALTECNIPLRKNKPIKVKCNQCEKEFSKFFNQIKKTNNNFCSRSCSVSFNNSIRIRSEESNNKTRMALLKPNPHKCLMCDTIMQYKIRKTCSKICLTEHKKMIGKIHGIKGGVASAASQQRRSKNEIYCSELCIKYFGENDIQCNEQIFKDKNGNFWDCDIYIKSLKIALLWDGEYWHGKNASNKQKARDFLKRKIILDNGSTYYTIIDKGKFNKNFVEEQFNLFIQNFI